MMSNGEILCIGVGILGGLFRLCMYFAPIPIFKRVLKKKTTERFSAIPYAIALFTCSIAVLYNTPFVSDGWRNFVVLLANAIGVCINAVYVFIFLHYAPPSSKRTMQKLLASVVTVFCTVLVTSVVAVQERKHRALLVGVANIMATIGLYASPLSVLKLVLKTKSVEFLPIWLSIFTFLCCLRCPKQLPSALGICLGFAQILLYLCFRNNSSSNNNNVVNHVVKVKDIEIDMEKQKNTDEKSSPDYDDDDAADEHDGRNDDKAIQITDFVQDHHHPQKPNQVN